MTTDISAIEAFLACPTPDAWIKKALTQQTILLIDHCNCEKKAASTALSLMYRYVEHPKLLMKMSKLAREELRHFEQVLKIMQQREITYETLTASRYAQALIKHVRHHEPAMLIDKLIIGAFIEARSCERFARLAPYLDDELAQFYRSLLASESRHFKDYLNLAQELTNEDIDDRIRFFADLEASLIESPDEQFRFHSGVPLN